MKRSIFILASLSVLVFVACSPSNKEAYLSQYQKFIEYVKTNSGNQSFSWSKADSDFEKFSKTYFKRWEDQLTFAEKATCKKYELEYHMIKVRHEAIALKNDIQGQIQDFLENDMPQIESFKKEVKEITTSFFDTLRQAWNSFCDDGSSATP